MDIVVSGSIAYDYLMTFPGHFKDHLHPEDLHQISLSFLVDEMTKHWGGVAANIGYTLAMLGMRPKLMGTAGRDFQDYRQWLESAGVDTSTVTELSDVFTASFFVNTDLDNNQIATFYAGAMGRARNYLLADVMEATPDLVVVSPNDPKAMANIAEECRNRKIRFIYDPSQQVARLSGEEISHDMQGAYAMFVNAYEARVICEKTGKSIDDLRQMTEILVITQGERGSHIYENGNLIEVPAIPAKQVQDPTGGGDAFRAGFIFALAHNLPIELAGRIGALCATYVLEQIGTQGHQYTIEEFVQRFRHHFDDGDLLNVVI